MNDTPRPPHFRRDDPIITPKPVDVPQPGKVIVEEPFWARWWARRNEIADKVRSGASKVMLWNDRVSRAWRVVRGKE